MARVFFALFFLTALPAQAYTFLTGSMRGVGKWYVTRKGKPCLELTARDVDENWCRHVFHAGGTYYLSKDQRPDRVVYRLVPERG